MASKRPRTAFESDLQRQESPFVYYGSPLPPLDADVRDDGSYVPVWKQDARDERGRKRFHGAFTGGFSAGYFNTVGTKEGWTPATFVSSRAAKAAGSTDRSHTQRAEDFMDEEDLADIEDSKHVQTVNAYAGLGGTAEEVRAAQTVVDLFRPSENETMGVKLLQRMGWRAGQGIGPKIRRSARLDETSRLGSEETHLFAPEDTRMIALQRKDDAKGLGFGPDQGNRTEKSQQYLRHDDEGNDHGDSEDFIARRRTALIVKKSVPQRRGFGLGVLNDTGSDDEDPYDLGPRMLHRRQLKEEVPQIPTVEGIRPKAGSFKRPTFLRKRQTQEKSKQSSLRRCSDGRIPLSGFLLAEESASRASSIGFAPVEIPKGWVSARQTLSSNSQQPWRSTSDAAKASALDPKLRASLLGESALPGKSVFDFLSEDARARIVAATGRTDLPAAKGESLPRSQNPALQKRGLWDLVPDLEVSVATAALARLATGWSPYAEDQDKRQRYRHFIELKSGINDALPVRLETMSVHDWVTELKEFAHAAQVFRPVSGLMATRFTSSRKVFEGGSEGDHNTLLSKPIEKPEDPTDSAARLGMYGPMTRRVLLFQPSRLVCKRFNVKPPAIEELDQRTDSYQRTGPHRTSEIVSKEVLSTILKDADPELVEKVAPGMQTSWFDPKQTPASSQGETTLLSRSRPADDVFAAVFGDDDNSEDTANS